MNAFIACVTKRVPGLLPDFIRTHINIHTRTYAAYRYAKAHAVFLRFFFNVCHAEESKIAFCPGFALTNYGIFKEYVGPFRGSRLYALWDVSPRAFS